MMPSVKKSKSALGLLDRPKPAIRLSRKDWLRRANGAVLCPVPGTGCASGSCPAGFFAEVGLRWWRRLSPDQGKVEAQARLTPKRQQDQDP